MRQFRSGIVVALGLFLLVRIAVQAEALRPLTPPQAAVASAHPAATAAGRAVLQAGGNAFDAAIAVAAALAVVEPYSSGIGGGGFFLLYRASDRKEVMIDARERAPAAASEEMYLDADGTFVRERSLNGPLAAAIPGTPAGLVHLVENYGRLPLKDSLAEAIRLAEQGFEVGPRYAAMAGYRKDALNAYPNAAAIFLGEDGDPQPGDKITQPDLAKTLRALAEQGADGFYGGDIAAKLVAGVRAGGGIWTLEDLRDYAVVERQPIDFDYRGIRVVTAPPPSSGGVVMAEAFNILSQFDLPALDEYTGRHLVIEAMRRAYRDRADYLGDPDYVDIPVARLTSMAYAQQLAADISIENATPSANLAPLGKSEGRDTTHFSIIDGEGNRVAATLSVNTPFGAVYVPEGTGVLLNNEMDDFSARPLTPNAYGLVGVAANAIGPGRRPLSSMTPTFLETPERVGVLGTPGGSRIISMVMIGILEFAAGRPPQDWVSASRYHHQYLPDEVQYEKGGLSPAAVADLRRRGHTLSEQSRNYGNMHAVLWNRAEGTVSAASDPRGEGAAMVFDVPRSAVSAGTQDSKSSSAVQ